MNAILHSLQQWKQIPLDVMCLIIPFIKTKQ